MGDERTAADVFGLLSDDIRLDVLRAVAVAQQERKQDGVAELSFSEIYERVDVDNTAKLSYHLGELTGTFLRKREGGYAFTHAGDQLVRFVLSENYRQPTDFGTAEASGSCLRCGEPGLRAGLRDQFFVLECPDCDGLNFTYKVTPALVRGRSGTDLVAAVARELTGDLLKARQGVCPDCAGRIETEVLDTSDLPGADSVPAAFVTASECQQCLRFLSLPLTHAVAYHPESIAFHWEHGVDVLATGTWELHHHLHDGRWRAERAGSDRAVYRVEMERDAATLRCYLDETAAVTHTERVQRREQGGRRS